MRVLYVINTGLVGGLQAHVKCLMQSLAGVAETAVAINTEIDPKVVQMFEEAGLNVYRLRGQSGHDWRVIGRFKRVLADFKPDVIHAHGLPFFCAVWLFFHRHAPIIHSLHTPPHKPHGKGLLEWFILDRLIDYWFPVSTSTWTEFRRWHPRAKGEVFFNPLRLSDFNNRTIRTIRTIEQSNNLIVGMVGRNADQKDWPSFHRVEELVESKFKCAVKSIEQSNNPNNRTIATIEFLNAGEKTVCNGREAIAKMDLFVMTSKHEQLPTTVLECFALGTPICGFIPVGGTSDILGFSKGPVREAFIAERDCGHLADIVMDILAHSEKRQALVEDGRQILESHFDAEKNCRGRLMEIYRRFTK